MTKPIPEANRKRGHKRPLPAPPGSLAELLTEFAAEKSMPPSVLQRYRFALRNLQDAVGRSPMPADFSHENLKVSGKRRNQATPSQQKKVRSELSAMRTFWRWCARKGLVEAPEPLPRFPGRQRTLSDEPGTLWHICVTRYFPANIRLRQQTTKDHYRTAIADLAAAVGHEPTPADLTDENLARVMTAAVGRGRSPETANERRNKLRALWEWCARKRIVDDFPVIRRMKAPKRIPRAWTVHQLTTLLTACRQTPGKIAPGIRASDFWVGLVLFFWNTGERLSAVMESRWEWLDEPSGSILIPAEVRKGQEADALYYLSPETLIVLRRIPSRSGLIFTWPHTRSSFFNHYKRILRRAGLPCDRKSGTHRLRKSVASHLAAGGHDASLAMGHSSSKVTRDHYLDPAIVGVVKPCEVMPALFDEPARLEYREV